MKFLVDAQLPRRLARRLREAGHEAIHTLDLPLGNRTTDTIINDLSAREHYAVVTKDSDFVNSFILSRRPYKLLLIDGQHPQRGVGGPSPLEPRKDGGRF
jgi:predicted nuclease of predicted toxin-antitoxin system